jgi:hypothetical protein
MSNESDKSTDSDVPHLSAEYYKARKNYNLFAGLLFLWEFVGIELPNNPWGNMNIRFKSPEAAPYVLLFILMFYAFRITIEWQQSDVLRRSFSQSKIDYFFSHFIAIVSLSLFFLQLAIKRQVITYFLSTPLRMSFISIGFILPSSFLSTYYQLQSIVDYAKDFMIMQKIDALAKRSRILIYLGQIIIVALMSILNYVIAEDVIDLTPVRLSAMPWGQQNIYFFMISLSSLFLVNIFTNKRIKKIMSLLHEEISNNKVVEE